MNVTVDDVRAARAGWYFDSTSAPTLTQVEAFIDEALSEVRNVFTQYGADVDDLEEGSPAYRHVHRWVVQLAAANVWESTPGSGLPNRYRDNATTARDQFLRQPEAFGVTELDELYAGKPSSPLRPEPVAEDIRERFSSPLNRYLGNKTGGF